MKAKATIIIIILLLANSLTAQNINADQLAEIIANKARFKPYDKSSIDELAQFDIRILCYNLKTDEQKYSFWLNIYNSYMLLNLRDTANQGNYTRFYKIKNIEIGGFKLSLFNIEHEFLRCGKKNKSLKFKKSQLAKKDSLLKKLIPSKPDYRVIFCIYKGLYGYPPFQIIENANLTDAFSNYLNQHANNYTENGSIVVFDWVKNYKVDLKNHPIDSIFKNHKTVLKKTPKAVFINNFFPKYEKVKFKEEEINPWLK